MKKTLKTLLVTTLLAAPSVFGADALQSEPYVKTIPLQLVSQNVQLVSQNVQLVSQNSEVSVTEDSLRLCGEVFANMMRLIPDSHPQIEPLGHVNVDDLPSPPQTLYDYFRIFERSLSRASLSDADSASLRTHINNSSYFNRFAIDLLISAMPDATPKEIVRGINALFCAVRFQRNLVNDVNCPSLLDDAKRMCNRLQAHNDSKPDDLLNLATYLNNPGQNPYEIVIFSYELYALHRDATPSDILTAGLGIKSSGEKYYDRASDLFVRAATHSNATLSNILLAANYLMSFGENYYARAASMYLNAANHRDASADVISKIISKIEQIRATYPTDSAEYKKYDDIFSELLRIKESRSK